MIFYMTENSEKNRMFAPGIAFWPKILFSDQIKHAIGQILMKFGPPGAIFSPGPPPGFPFFDKCFLDFAILGPLKARFDQLDR